MKIGIIGLPQAGKNTLFELLAGISALDKNRPVIGEAPIGDERFDILARMYSPKKLTQAKIDIALLPTIEGSISQSGIIESIANVDALLHVVRAFEDDSIYHLSGSINPRRDIETVNSELILSDLIFIEKRLERIEKSIKRKKDESLSKERELLLKLKGHLEEELPLRLLGLTDDEKSLVSGYPFLTLKEMLLALNVLEGDLSKKELLSELKISFAGLKIEMMQISAKVEAEVAGIESEQEREEFLKELGIEEKALEALTSLCIKALGLISFFTVGPNELRQWLIRRGISSVEAAGTIH
ncbi:DUF933 domain-containing protein, partial [bacterium]|nr:DUF933 domain-containing protein [bacterium]